MLKSFLDKSLHWIKKHSVFFGFFLVSIYHLWSLMRFPPPFVDEVWLISRAWPYLSTGLNFGQLDKGILEVFDGYWTFFPWLHTWIYAIALRIAGAPALLPVRLISLLFGIFLLIAVFFIGRKVGSFREAVIAVTLLSLSGIFNYSAHLARADIIVAALGFWAIAIYLNNSSSRWWLSFLSGFLLGLAFEVHPNGIIYVPAIITLYFIDNGFRFLKKREFWIFLGGLVAGLGIYIILHILPYPNTYFAMMEFFGGDARLPPLLTFDFVEIIDAMIITGGLLLKQFMPLLLIVFWQIGIIFKRKSKRNKAIAVLAILLFLEFSLFIKNKEDYYLILIAPIFYLILASFLDEFIIWGKSNPRYFRLAFIFVWTSILSMVMLTGFTNAMNHYPNYQMVQKQINKSIEADDVIMGAQTYWLGLPEHIYYSWEQLAFYKSLQPNASLKERLEYFRPDIFIIDSHLEYFITDQPEKLPYSGVVSIPLTEFNLFLDQHAIMVDEFTNPSYGFLQVYRIQWEEE